MACDEIGGCGALVLTGEAFYMEHRRGQPQTSRAPIPYRPLTARQRASWRILKTRREGRSIGGGLWPELMQCSYLRQPLLKSCSGTDTNW